MLPSDVQNSESGSRKFSFKDLVYLEILNACRKFGLNNDQLKMLKSDFYDKEEEDDLFNHGDRILLLTYIGEKVTLMITNEGKAIFADMYYFAFLDTKLPSYLQFNVNEIVKKLWYDRLKTTEDEDFAKYMQWSEVLEHADKKQAEGKELEVLRILRENDYTKITVNKKGKSLVIHAEETGDSNGMSELELVEKIQNKDFGSISIQKRNGKTVGYKLEDVFKV